MRRVVAGLAGLVMAASAWTGVQASAAQPTVLPASVTQVPVKAAQALQVQAPATHGDPAVCTHGCYASSHVCLINATTWGPIATMISRWWYASYSVRFDLRSTATGCNDFPGSRRITFSAFNDPSWNNCVKLQGTSRAADGHWNNHIVIYMNWGIPSCRTSQVEIEHRTGAVLGWVLGAKNWNETESPYVEQILNMDEWSIANINQVYNLSGQQLINIYGSQA